MPPPLPEIRRVASTVPSRPEPPRSRFRHWIHARTQRTPSYLYTRNRLGEIHPQKIEKCASAPSPVVVLDLQPLEEYQRRQHVPVPQRPPFLFFRDAFPQLLDRSH